LAQAPLRLLEQFFQLLTPLMLLSLKLLQLQLAALLQLLLEPLFLLSSLLLPLLLPLLLYFFSFFPSVPPFFFSFPALLDEVKPDGHGVRFPTREVSTSSSAVRTSLESWSPLDPSLKVIGSLIPPDWRGSRAPS